MRASLLVFMTATLTAPGAAVAATPAAAFTFGTLYSAYGSGSDVACTLLSSPTSIYVPASGTKVLMTFVEADYTNITNGNGYVAAGVATLNFTSSTSGTMVFDSFTGGGIAKPEITFSNYASVYSPKVGTLVVTFSMSFGGACGFSVKALYHSS